MAGKFSGLLNIENLFISEPYFYSIRLVHILLFFFFINLIKFSNSISHNLKNDFNTIELKFKIDKSLNLNF